MRIQLWDVAAALDGDGASYLLIYGRTGTSSDASVSDVDVCLRLHGLWPFLYIPRPQMVSAQTSPVEVIERALKRRAGTLIVEAEFVSRTDVVGFNVASDMWRLSLRSHRDMWRLRDAINCGEIASNFSRKSYSSDFAYTSQAQVVLGVPNCGWFEVDDSLLAQQCVYRQSSCVLEYRLDYLVPTPGSSIGLMRRSITPLDETLWAQFQTRLRVASIDIECEGRRGFFPDPLRDPIIQIGSFIITHGDTQPLAFTVHTWRRGTDCDRPLLVRGFTAHYILCDNEQDMITKWAASMRTHSVDLYTGWNIDNFDMPYIVRRAEFLMPHLPTRLQNIGRRMGGRVVAKESRFSSKQLGSRESYTLDGVEGVHFLDAFVSVLTDVNKRRRSYTLDYVASEVLARKDAYRFSLVESQWLASAVSVQLLGLDSKPSRLESPQLIGSLQNVVDRATYPLAVKPLVAGEYLLELSRQNKSPYLFLRFFDDAGRCVGFSSCMRDAGPSKEDVHYTRISEMWNGTDDERRDLAVYNLVDCLLPWQILVELRTLGTMVEMARVSKTDITRQLQNGQNVRSTMLLHWEAHRSGFVVPFLPPRIKQKMANCEPVPDSLWFRHDLDAAAAADKTISGGGDDDLPPSMFAAAVSAKGGIDIEEIEEEDEPPSVATAAATTTSSTVAPATKQPSLVAGKNKTKFTGGYVGKMEARYYGTDEPVHTVDFESLYPSLMLTHNLCPTTQVIDRTQLAKAGLTLEQHCVESPVGGVFFVRHEVRRGLLPTILDNILAARKRAKRLLGEATDIGVKASLDGRQLALKVTANSVYGFTGNTLGTLPALFVAASVTTYGKAAILQSKEVVEREWPGSEVIYIDTDSLFVRNRQCKTVAEAMACGLAQSKRVTEIFMAESPHNRRVLAFEKVNCPFLGIAAKHYTSLYWTRIEEPDMVYERGVETVRRDVPLFVSETMGAVFFLVMRCGDPTAACDVIRLVVSQLWMCEVPMSKLVMAKEYKKEVYANAQPHVQVVEKMRRRDPTTAPKLGDRVRYVVIPHNSKHTNVSDAVESPEYCLENDIYPDQVWYLAQLETCLSRVMTLVVGERVTRELFHGAHTLRRKTILPKRGGLFDFVKRGAEAVAEVARAAADAANDDDDDDDIGATTAPPPAPTKQPPTKQPPPKRAKKAPPPPKGGGIKAFFTSAPPPPPPPPPNPQ